MSKWQYKIVDAGLDVPINKIADTIDELGEDGWELVAIVQPMKGGGFRTGPMAGDVRLFMKRGVG